MPAGYVNWINATGDGRTGRGESPGVEVGGATAASTSRSRPRRRGSPVFVALRKIKDEDRPDDAGGAGRRGRHPERVPGNPARAAPGRERPRQVRLRGGGPRR